ncbi:MAG TPA: transcriptional regulator [Microbacteriaceae bacterium]|jgi:deoxyribonucleoside regulator|nr:transcriptional regulator [Microbacteriaceae bacterium]
MWAHSAYARGVDFAAEGNNELLAVRAAELYYEDNKTHEEIGSILRITRWKVGRLLIQAREQGIIRIEIVHPRARRLGMEHQLNDLYGFESSIVVPRDGDYESVGERVAIAAADYLVSMRPRTHRLGVSWGKTLHLVAQALPEGWANPVSVVQINGAVSQSAAPGLAAATATTMAQKSRGSVTLLPTPAILEREETKNALESDRSISAVLDQACEADTYLFSAGPASPVSIHVESGYLDAGEITELQKKGAVGDVLGRYITAEGTIADKALDSRTLGLSLEHLRNATRSIAVISGPGKHPVALAIATHALATVMITDEDTAEYLVAHHQERHDS